MADPTARPDSTPNISGCHFFGTALHPQLYTQGWGPHGVKTRAEGLIPQGLGPLSPVKDFAQSTSLAQVSAAQEELPVCSCSLLQHKGCSGSFRKNPPAKTLQALMLLRKRQGRLRALDKQTL